MKTKMNGYCKFVILVLFVCAWMSFFTHPLRIEAQQTEALITDIEERVQDLMDKGNIPGLALVILRPDRPDYIKGFGFADLEKETTVTGDTLFEIGSCSKAFTALAALQLEKEGLINLDDPVSKYLPWFKPTYKNKHYEITLRQFLHHTSGIPWNSIRSIPLGDEKDSLEQTVRNIKNIELESVPGTRHKYATINYDVIGRVIEVTTGKSYEDYMTKHVIQPLGLTGTYVGIPGVDPTLAEKVATGYKTGFFAPRKYNAPAYRGNYPAGYIVSNGKDIARWLKLQMGLEESPLTPLIQKSHQHDETIPPDLQDVRNLSAYVMGWQISLLGDGRISHGGYNPNYTSYFVFSPRSKTAVAVMTNSDSTNHVPFIANLVMNRAHGIKPEREFEPPAGIDKSTSIISIILFLYLLVVAGFIISVVINLIKRKCQFEPLTLKTLGKIALGFPVLAPFLFGIYLLPTAMGGVTWETAVVWAPISFKAAAILLVTAFAASYLGYIILTIFPHKNKYLRALPMLIVLSVLSGLANAMVIFLITGSLSPSFRERLLYMVYYFLLAMLLYILGRKVISTKLTKITFDIVYDMRMRLLEKVFYTSYQRFENLDRGRVFATINDDTGQIGNSANIFVTMLTSIITILGCFIFLATIAFWATIVTIAVILCITVLYYIVSQEAQVYMEEARDTRDVFMRLLNGLIDGFKELSIHFNKKREYRDDLEKTTDEFRNKTIVAMVKFINAFMVGESMLIAILGAVGFAVPKLFPEIQTFTLISFIMILLYLIGPITGILATIPQVMQISVAWKRVKEFIKDIPANLDPEDMEKLELNIKHVDHIEAKGVTFKYESENEEDAFSVGPVDFEAKKGEVVFIIGGNGSGKTTLAKLLTGLYIPHEGSILVDGKNVNNYQLGEYFSTVFSGYHLFEKLYNIDLSDEEKQKEGEEYLKTLHLAGKVSFEADSLSTIDLSGGQRKRLALLQCYLEDCPIYLFDEVAADQDPEFRKFFYRELLTRMKEKGKIVIAITHDDHYFDVADKVIKMDMGNIDVITEGKTQLRLTS